MSNVREMSDTRRRAELRGRESVARWRMRTGVWAGRLLALFTALAPLYYFTRRGGPPGWAIAVQLVIAAAVLFATERTARGGRWAATTLLVGFVLHVLLNALGGASLTDGIVLKLAITFCLAQGVLGTFALASVRRDAALVPPAPARPAEDGSAPTRRPVIRAES